MGLCACGAREQAPEASVPTASTELSEDVEELFPDVLAVKIDEDADGTYTFHVTLSSPYDTPDRYADAWRVLSPEEEELGVRILRHDHATEQPFTRSLRGVLIPSEVERVEVQGRDQVSGWGGKTVEIAVPR